MHLKAEKKATEEKKDKKQYINERTKLPLEGGKGKEGKGKERERKRETEEEIGDNTVVWERRHRHRDCGAVRSGTVKRQIMGESGGVKDEED